MSKKQDILAAKLKGVSAKTLSLGAKQFMRRRNEQKIKFEENFTYDPLPGPRSIRLLSIRSGADTDVLACDVATVDLDSKPVFEALSYTWDLDPTLNLSNGAVAWEEDTKREERPIQCNGRTMHVTMNLYHALTELRRQGMDRPLWADQVCINQDDGDEKMAQLAIMVDIYASAARATIWLGKTSIMLNTGIDFIDRLPDDPKDEEEARTIETEEPKTGSLTKTLRGVASVGQIYHWVCALTVIGRRWSARAWTLQEFLLAADFRLLLGDREINPKSLVKGASQVVDFFVKDQLARRLGGSISILTVRRFITARAALFSEREKFRSGKIYSAEEYLEIIRNRRSTERKDKVFAGAALLKPVERSSVDYRSTTLDIFIDYSTVRLFPETGVFGLSLVGGAASAVEGLPTWVPDLSKVLAPRALKYCGCPTFKSPLLSEGHAIKLDGRKARLRGAKWDVVKATGESIWPWSRYDDDPYNSDPKYRQRTSTAPSSERFGLMFALLNDLGPHYTPTSERTIDAFWQTLIGSINLTTDDDIAVWRNRFHHWFAFTLCIIRYDFRVEQDTASRRINAKSKKWMVPLIADAVGLERRVSQFLDVHDTVLDGEADGASGPSLRKMIETLAKLLGTPELTEETGWGDSTANVLAHFRREEFYAPVSVFTSYFELVYEGRRFLTSEKGYIGMGTEWVRKGDLIYLFAGASVPYVLRPVPGQDGTYNLVGEAYVHGIMAGGDELLEGLNVEDITLV